MIGKMGFVVVFGVIYIYIVEFYLIVVCNGVMGISFCIVCFGGMVVFYIVFIVSIVR